MARPRRHRTGLAIARRTGALLVLSASLWAPAPAGATGGLIVVPTPASGPVLSYFRLSVRRASAAPAGSIVLRNTSPRTLNVALSVVDGQTLDTLGSAYASPGSRAHGATRWVYLAKRRVTLGPGASAPVAVSVFAPRRARPGDYLAGVSVEALNQKAETAHRGATIASVVRYVIGVEATVPGARHSKLQFTGARVERQPSALAFLLLARNRGNVILQNVQGRALVTDGKRTVASVALGPGTFVTRSSISYPIPARGERPHEGTVYRVRAYLRYAGGIARLDTLVRFGRADAARQQTYARPSSPSHGSGVPAWLLALLGAAFLYGLAITVILLRRRRDSAVGAGAR
ncbi:MAG TPA: hypothetical protein VNZ05_05850 [Solirubrobacteraceae bacterium]|jgi:hypothetical protein|nr:hypothetical protein [Solirubrobacteraceae bacterium]